MVKKSHIGDVQIGARAALHNSVERIFANLPAAEGWASHDFNGINLGSRYQPIFDLKVGRPAAYEGLLDASQPSGQTLKPETVFALSMAQHQELHLDWLCRALHMRNFANLGGDRGILFLNAYPQAAIEDPHHPQAFSRMMAFYGINPSEVVIEILETGVTDEAQLIDAVQLYRRLGCKIAIDDFGVCFSNFDRLWKLHPDIVKIDRAVIASAAREPQARKVLANMVKLIRECGAKIVIEGVETRDEALLAIEVGADFVQGYFFARPSRTAVPSGLCAPMFKSLFEESAKLQTSCTAPSNVDNSLEIYECAIEMAVIELQEGVSFVRATELLRSLPRLRQAYLAADESLSNPAAAPACKRLIIEMIETIADAQQHCATPMARLSQLIDQALARPHQVHIARGAEPMATPNPCITLSCAFEMAGSMHVICADLIDQRASAMPGKRVARRNDTDMDDPFYVAHRVPVSNSFLRGH